MNRFSLWALCAVIFLFAWSACVPAAESEETFPTRSPANTPTPFPGLGDLVDRFNGGQPPQDLDEGVKKASATPTIPAPTPPATSPTQPTPSITATMRSSASSTAPPPATLSVAPTPVVSSSNPDAVYCEWTAVQASWDMQWSGLNDKRLLGKSSAPGNFTLEAGQDPGYRDQTGRASLSAMLVIAVQTAGPVPFTIGGNGVYELTLLQGNVARTLLSARPESYQMDTATFDLAPGIYTLVLQYFDRDGQVRVAFQTAPEALRWTQVAGCTGTVAARPAEPYFVYASKTETLPDVARRFGLATEELSALNPQVGTGLFLVPGSA